MSFRKYESRNEAGRILVDFIENNQPEMLSKMKNTLADFFCFAIPNGGIPVAEGFCAETNIQYDMLIVRKIKIPYNPEAGFGSITTDGTVLINEPLLERLNLSKDEINKSIELTKSEIRERLEFYNKPKDLSEQYQNQIQKKQIILIDDGLASGFTMLAAIKMIKKYSPAKIYIAVPTAPQRTVVRIKSEVAQIFCPNIKRVVRFSVASAYKNWYDVSKSEVLEIITNSEHYINDT
jgi:predicted phosphoribosyltransferase